MCRLTIRLGDSYPHRESRVVLYSGRVPVLCYLWSFTGVTTPLSTLQSVLGPVGCSVTSGFWVDGDSTPGSGRVHRRRSEWALSVSPVGPKRGGDIPRWLFLRFSVPQILTVTLRSLLTFRLFGTCLCYPVRQNSGPQGKG